MVLQCNFNIIIAFVPGIRCAQAGYFNPRTLLNFPVDLTGKGQTGKFSVTSVNSCSGNYSVYDYTGFQDNWETLTDSFFEIKMKGHLGFEVKVQ